VHSPVGPGVDERAVAATRGSAGRNFLFEGKKIEKPRKMELLSKVFAVHCFPFFYISRFFRINQVNFHFKNYWIHVQ
jgi:hypothetical protein